MSVKVIQSWFFVLIGTLTIGAAIEAWYNGYYKQLGSSYLVKERSQGLHETMESWLGS